MAAKVRPDSQSIEARSFATLRMTREKQREKQVPARPPRQAGLTTIRNDGGWVPSCVRAGGMTAKATESEAADKGPAELNRAFLNSRSGSWRFRGWMLERKNRSGQLTFAKASHKIELRSRCSQVQAPFPKA